MRSNLFALFALVVCSTAVAKPTPKKAPPPPVASKKAPPTVPTGGSNDSPSTGTETQSVRGPTRIDFDDRLIQGQTNKSGAVYLYDRKELKIRSMIKKRENFREEIVGSLYDS